MSTSTPSPGRLFVNGLEGFVGAALLTQGVAPHIGTWPTLGAALLGGLFGRCAR